MAEVPDINVDELRRRARRRLIGAIVLALAAAIIVPMLLESEPKPLGEDVSVKIPPEDNGKFVNRLSDKSPKSKAADAASVPAKEPAKPEPAKEEPAKAEPATPATSPPAAPPAPPREPTSAATAPTESAAAPGNVAAPKKSVAQAEQKMLAPTGKPPASIPPPAPAPAPVAAPAGAAAVSADAAKEGFSVQLAAFADDKGANSLVNKLKRAAYPAYTEPLSTSRGTLWRVRVGPYPSRDAAVEVRDRLKGEGYNGIVAAAK